MRINSLTETPFSFISKNRTHKSTKNWLFLISLVSLLALSAVANATYTDYIGAGHNSGVTVTACSVDDTATGQKTVDGSGLTGPSGTHSTVWDDGWLAFEGATNPNPARSSYTYWIRYDFGEPYNLADMWVWNSNGDTGADYTNRGLRNVYIDYSLNGSTWTPLTSTEFSQANNSSSYAGFAGPDFGGASARYVLISAVNNWGAGDGWYGLAEVKFNIGGGAGPGVDILGSWTSGTSHTKEAGSNRALIFTAHVEDNDSPAVNLASVTYGGQPMTKVIEETVGSPTRAYVVAYILNEAGITAASGNSFSPNWGSNNPDKVGYSSVFLSAVNQSYLIGDSNSNSVAGSDTVSTDPLYTSSGDKVIVAGACGSTGSYTLTNGFTEALELSMTSSDGVAGHKSATGVNETPTTVHSTTSRKAIIGFVVQYEGTGPPDTDPPTPTTSTWDASPSATSHNSITMTATTATDPSGVQYYFNNVTDPAHDSGWQASSTYNDFGLNPETEYTYKVRTRDQSPSQNTGNWSSTASATTLEAPEACPSGDLTGDCKVNEYDLNCLALQWLDLDCGSIPPSCVCADIDGHTFVDFNDFAEFSEDWGKEGVTVVLNEFMASNRETHADDQGEYDDWIEIHNPTATAYDIGGMWLEDATNPKWQIPTDRPSETTIAPYGYVLIWADGDTTATPGLHASFALDRAGDQINLYATDGTTLIDTISFVDQLRDISYGRYPDSSLSWYFMSSPTPLATNTLGMAGRPFFSHPGGTYSTTFNLTLTTSSPTADIYYTLDGSEPTSGSTAYTAPISISRTRWVRARAYDVNLAPSLIESRTYMRLASDVQSFQSNLPIVIIDSFGLNIDNANRDFHEVISAFIDTDEVTGTASITDAADYTGCGGMHIRGNSTAYYPKRQFRFETWDENRPDPLSSARYMDENVSLLGLPSESDWIIHGPWSDRTQMRNFQMYTWSNLIGRYASRTVFVEVFLDYDDNGTIDWDTGLDGSSTDY
ncbi:MAG: chitobiase/beta-hexosaminidase C-terminal domain-containing protein, partial [Planctomycetota bacterium]